MSINVLYVDVKAQATSIASYIQTDFVNNIMGFEALQTIFPRSLGDTKNELADCIVKVADTLNKMAETYLEIATLLQASADEYEKTDNFIASWFTLAP